MNINPIKAMAAIVENYQSYLGTTFRLQDPELQRQLLENLREQDKFVKGPILEVTPEFKKGASIADLVEEGLLSPEFYRMQTESLPVARQLYQHQERAVRKLTGAGRNIIVSTGTGSGKTEAFLIPILDYLFKEKERGSLTPGVRALLLYPMNALANDQLKRLRLLLARYQQITFGRYTGETETKHRSALDKYRNMYQSEPLPNELISREQMWEQPPHMLLTNYAMLEYLLLRPQDTIFFDGQLAEHWRFLVIDEAHTYSGAKGIELAMLLRRLKERIVGSDRGKLQCIGTSATLGDGRDNQHLIVAFAERLFGEEFEWKAGDEGCQDVVDAAKLPVVTERGCWGKARPWIYAEWEKMIESGRSLSDKLTAMYESGLNADIPAAVMAGALETGRQHEYGWQAFLYEVLKGDQNLLRLQQELQAMPKLLAVLPKALQWDSPDAASKVVSLVNLANQAKIGADYQPLLPARYHVFVRAIEGAYLALKPEKRLYLERYENIIENGEEYKVFETAACRQCGATYLVGQRERIENEREILKNPTGEHCKIEYYLLLDKENGVADQDEDEEVEFPEEADHGNNHQKYILCLHCGTIDQQNILQFPCQCGEEYHIALLQVSTRNGKVFQCPACGKRSPNGVVWRFLVGTDAAASVLVSALYQQIAPGAETGQWAREEAHTALEDEWSAEAPETDHRLGKSTHGGLRKLLVFSDSRQDAAFFAPYLNRTYNQILHRGLIIKTILANAETMVNNCWRLQDMVVPLCQMALTAGFFKGNSYQEQIDEAWKWLMQEFLAVDRRISLEGMGLLGFTLVVPHAWSPPRALLQGKWGLSPTEAVALIKVLVDTLRAKGVVAFPDHVSPRDESFKPRNREFFFRANRPEVHKGILSWNSTRLNSRLDYLIRLSHNLGTGLNEQDCREVLDNIWLRVLHPEERNQWHDYFSSQPIRDEGVVYQLQNKFWEIKSSLIDERVHWYVCDKCRNFTLNNVRGTCPSYRCEGRLQRGDPQEYFRDNHYYRLYQNILPIKMQAEEHTAQLTSEAAAELQNRFINKDDVNILSCSTTFELGVDVGELETVFMRNMPPSAANYIQRAGRAGRRTDAAAFVLTYAQRRSHDLDHYREPWRMVSGQINAPYFTLSNRKIVQRHVYATALASFWREHRDLFGRVVQFFFHSEASGSELLAAYLSNKPAALKSSLLKIVPEALHQELDIEHWGWTAGLFNEETGVMVQADAEIKSDVQGLEVLKQALFNQNRNVDHVTRLIRTLKEKDLIGFLSNHNVIPKYGFPVDVVELQILNHSEEAKRLQLERDLRIAISEYAPSSQVVAGGRLWTSRYIRRLPDRAWEAFYYAICDTCQSYMSVRAELRPGETHCSVCGSSFGRNQGVFIVPAFGFVASHGHSGNPGEEKPEKTYATRVYFSGQTSGEEENARFQLGAGIEVELTTASRGKMAVINNAGYSGFQVCRNCGFAILGSERATNSHQNPWGSPCLGNLQSHLSLGYEFETDILKIYLHGYQDERKAFWYSLLYALLEGASSAMQIERGDLDGCLCPMPGNPFGSFALILFDDVPGGAGHVRRIASEDSFKEILHASMDRLQRCECGGDEGKASCYGCLRHYDNQFCHGELNRGMVIEFLSKVLDY